MKKRKEGGRKKRKEKKTQKREKNPQNRGKKGGGDEVRWFTCIAAALKNCPPQKTIALTTRIQ